MKKTKLILWQCLIGLIPLFYLLAIWNKLPEIVPTHFNAKGEANDFNSKYFLVGTLFFMFAISIGVSLILNNIHKIDPKQRYTSVTPVMKKMSWLMMIFLTIVSISIVYSTEHYTKTNNMGFSLKQPIILISLLFAVLGNFMNNIKPNYFIGIRTPWALEDEENWRKTHHLSSKLWFFGGLMLIGLIIGLPVEFSHTIFIGGLIPMAIIPFAYSYNLFRKKQKTTKETLDKNPTFVKKS